MSLDQRFILFNRLNSDKVYNFKGEFLNNVSVEIEINYKFKIVGVEQFIVVGELEDHVSIDLEILSVSPNMFKFIFDDINDGPTFMSRLYELSKKLLKDVSNQLSFFSINEEPWFKKIHMKKEQSLTEGKKPRSSVRKIVNDIIKIFKEEGVGNFVLPEDISDEMIYSFEGFESDLTVEVNIVKTKEVDGLDVDGAYYRDDDVLEVEIIYNPTYGNQIMYDLVGKLNELVRHELQHVIQYERGEDIDSDETDPEKYYQLPHEIDAQIKGLMRLSKLRKEPFEFTVRNWFDENEEKHNLSDEQREKVIQKILQNRK